MKLCLATNNRHKLEEISPLLGDKVELCTLEDIGCTEELAEEQDTIEGNSLQKAQYVFDHYHVSCVADDSGLEVDALGGLPGVNSAYYAGPQKSYSDNVNLLLKNMTGVENRKARFRTVLTLVEPGGVRQFEGQLSGVILSERKGAGGFGYDPVFLPDGCSKTQAEMSMEEKNRISARSVAVARLVRFLKAREA